MGARLAIEGGPPVREKPFPPWPHFGEDEIEAAVAVLRSGQVNYWTGRKGREFEERFAEYVGVKHAIAVNSGTSALHVALYAAEVGPGDEVIVPARTFIATAAAVLHQNALPIFADVDPKTHNLSPASVRELITPRTKAIIAVHLAGHPAEMDEIMAIAAEHNLVVIEDAAQAHGAEYKGRKVGSWGHLGAFSFCQDKIITTGGEGGMVTTNDDRWARLARACRDHGWWQEEKEELLRSEALRIYVHHRLGFNYRLTEMQSAIGLKALEKLDQQVEKRRENAYYLNEHLREVEVITTPYEAPYVKHSYYRYYCTVKPERLKVSRDQFVKAVRAEGVPILLGTSPENYLEEVFQKQVGYGKTPCPFRCPLYEGGVDYTSVSLPQARRLAQTAFCLLVHPTIERADLDDVVAAIGKVAEAYGEAAGEKRP
ncbi:MAG TPA: DegT/DnrJ/EryC1/StrS family aminotransferase [Armatimonadetes bacterium]|nr:DegT/DnrJ/EryC1/StrS family aminotransferase [Armatimonadota bacterium]